MVFQNFELIDYLSVIDNVLLPCRIGDAVTLTKEVRDRAQALLLAAGGCTTFQDFLDTVRGPQAADVRRRVEQQPAVDAIAANRFVITSAEQGVVGVPQVVFARERATLADFARAYGLGYDELIAANPGVDPWLPGENTPILLPTQFVLPDVPRRGVVLNIATKRLFYFPQDGIVRTPPARSNARRF